MLNERKKERYRGGRERETVLIQVRKPAEKEDEVYNWDLNYTRNIV